MATGRSKGAKLKEITGTSVPLKVRRKALKKPNAIIISGYH
jgi:hypothetical protein